MKKNVKYLFTFLISAFLVFIFAGTFSACTAEEELKIFPVTEGRFNLSEKEYVTMRIVSEEEKNNSSALLRIENHTESRLGYSTIFSLQYYSKNNWGPDLLHGKVWDRLGCGLLASEAEEHVNIFSLVQNYNNSKKGIYKLTKQFNLTSDWYSGSGEIINGIILSAEFELK